VTYVPALLWTVHLTGGTTQVSSSGLRLRGLFIRGLIPWSEVADITDRYTQGRNGGWWTVSVQTTKGRKQRLPGFYSEGRAPGGFSRPDRDKEFEDQLWEVRKRMRQLAPQAG
jgi:hypothetical protein